MAFILIIQTLLRKKKQMGRRRSRKWLLFCCLLLFSFPPSFNFLSVRKRYERLGQEVVKHTLQRMNAARKELTSTKKTASKATNRAAAIASQIPAEFLQPKAGTLTDEECPEIFENYFKQSFGLEDGLTRERIELPGNVSHEQNWPHKFNPGPHEQGGHDKCWKGERPGVKDQGPCTKPFYGEKCEFFDDGVAIQVQTTFVTVERVNRYISITYTCE